jgi:hypothetical protein
MHIDPAGTAARQLQLGIAMNEGVFSVKLGTRRIYSFMTGLAGIFLGYSRTHEFVAPLAGKLVYQVVAYDEYEDFPRGRTARMLASKAGFAGSGSVVPAENASGPFACGKLPHHIFTSLQKFNPPVRAP